MYKTMIVSFFSAKHTNRFTELNQRLWSISTAYYYDENSRRNQLYWTTDATKALIKLRGDRESEFEQGGARKSQLWVDICRRMRSMGYDFTPEKVSKKWHNILITYNKNLSKKQHSQQVNWEFFDDIDAVLKNRRIEIESTSSYQEDSSPAPVTVSLKRRAAPEISFFEIEKLVLCVCVEDDVVTLI